MKINKTTSNKFNPYTVKLTIETREEAQALYAIFNKIDAAMLLPKVRDIRQAIGKEYYVEDSDAIIANGVKYSEFYK